MVTLWQSSLSSSSSSLNVHVKYSTEYENCCCWSASLRFRFCFLFGFVVLSEVERCAAAGLGKNTWMTAPSSSRSLLSPVWFWLSGFGGKTILRHAAVVGTAVAAAAGFCRLWINCCCTIIDVVFVLGPVLLFPLLTAHCPDFDEALITQVVATTCFSRLVCRRCRGPTLIRRGRRFGLLLVVDDDDDHGLVDGRNPIQDGFSNFGGIVRARRNLQVGRLLWRVLLWLCAGTLPARAWNYFSW